MTDETPTHKHVASALAAVMGEMPAISKARHPNQDGGLTYAYRGIEEITKEVQVLFAKHGIVFVPNVLAYEVKDLLINNKPWTDTILTVAYDIHHGQSDTSVRCTVMGIGRDNSDKGANKAMTQAFKYALIQTLCISDAKDDTDGTEPGSAPPPRRRSLPPEKPEDAPKISDQRQGVVIAMFESKGITESDAQLELTSMAVSRRVGSFAELTTAESNAVLKHLAKVPTP